MGNLNNSRGVALLMTMLIITLITVVTLQFGRKVRSGMYAAANFRDGIQLGFTVKSAYNAAQAVLSVDGQESDHDSLHEIWANVALLSGYSAYFFDRDQVEIQINDHSGRIQLNALLANGESENRVNQEQRALLERFLAAEEFGLDDDQIGSIVDSLIDWLDEDDDETGLGGAEDSYYRSLSPSYTCKNGPIEFIEELLLVKGITPELYYGTEEKLGIAGFLTPNGNDGRININTAEPLVLLALAETMDEAMVVDLLDFRDNEDNDDELARKDWYKSILPGDVQIADSLVAVKSAYFEIRVAATAGKMRKNGTAIVNRAPDNSVYMISWKVE